MSLHFGANQYEDAFVPSRLCQYQIPRSFRKWPKQQTGGSQPIVDDKGYIYKRDPINRDTPKSDIKCWWEPIQKVPGTVKEISVKPGIWLVTGRRANWIETMYTKNLKQDTYNNFYENDSYSICEKLSEFPINKTCSNIKYEGNQPSEKKFEENSNYCKNQIVNDNQYNENFSKEFRLHSDKHKINFDKESNTSKPELLNCSKINLNECKSNVSKSFVSGDDNPSITSSCEKTYTHYFTNYKNYEYSKNDKKECKSSFFEECLSKNDMEESRRISTRCLKSKLNKTASNTETCCKETKL